MDKPWNTNPDKYTEYKKIRTLKRKLEIAKDKENYLQNAREIQKEQTSKKLTVRFYTYRIQTGDDITPRVVEEELNDPDTRERYKKAFRSLWRGTLCSYEQLVAYNPRKLTDDERTFMDLIKPVSVSPTVSPMTIYFRRNPDKYTEHLRKQRIFQRQKRIYILNSGDAEDYLKKQREHTKFKRHRKLTLEFYDKRILAGESITTDVIRNELNNPVEIKTKRPANLVSFDDLVKYAHSRQAVPHLVCDILKN